MSTSIIVGQMLSGMTAAIFLFMIASGLSLIFGVLKILNFAHGSFYMVGAYVAWQIAHSLSDVTGNFWFAVVGAALGVALLGGLTERIFFRYLYSRDELYQLLFTYGLVLIIGDATKYIWGARQLSVQRPEVLSGAIQISQTSVPLYSIFILAVGLSTATLVGLLLTKSGPGRLIRAAAADREMLSALGGNVGWIYTGMFMFSSALAGLAGALVSPIQSIVPGMDSEVIVQAFIVVVIGGLGSFWGTFWGAMLYGQVLAFGILIFPGFSLFSAYALMAVILVVRPWGLFGKPAR